MRYVCHKVCVLNIIPLETSRGGNKAYKTKHVSYAYHDNFMIMLTVSLVARSGILALRFIHTHLPSLQRNRILGYEVIIILGVEFTHIYRADHADYPLQICHACGRPVKEFEGNPHYCRKDEGWHSHLWHSSGSKRCMQCKQISSYIALNLLGLFMIGTCKSSRQLLGDLTINASPSLAGHHCSEAAS